MSCSHTVTLICEGYVECPNCGHRENAEPCTFPPVSQKDLRAVVGEEVYESMTKANELLRRGTITVTSIDRETGCITVDPA